MWRDWCAARSRSRRPDLPVRRPTPTPSTPRRRRPSARSRRTASRRPRTCCGRWSCARRSARRPGSCSAASATRAATATRRSISCARRSRSIRRFARAHNDLGILLQGQGRLAEAEASYRRAIALDARLDRGHEQSRRRAGRARPHRGCLRLVRPRHRGRRDVRARAQQSGCRARQAGPQRGGRGPAPARARPQAGFRRRTL